ncbi:MAG: hypothetical protein JW861_07690 [Bacteroidales bacterium]|nr:hypothetical protein [Bacteroidales bacterium]
MTANYTQRTSPGKRADDFRLVILRNESEYDHLEWVESISRSTRPISLVIIDLTRDDWYEKVAAEAGADCFIVRPPGATAYFKQLYDERLFIIRYVLGKNIYPTYEEVAIYENKRMLDYWMKANNVPHPATRIFYHLEDALYFTERCNLPVVGKTAIGAGGSGVRIFRERSQLKTYILKTFSDKGLMRTWGPNLRKGNIPKRILKRLAHIPSTISYFRKKHQQATVDPQKWFVILQDFIPAEFEWRCVRIGDSFFGHKKLPGKGELISGTSRVSWEVPPPRLLDFIEEVTDKRGFYSQAVDLFEDAAGNYFVNELQCYFGSKNPHQMLRNGVPGRFVRKGKEWIFEEGTFNTNNSHDLRLSHVISLIDQGLFSKKRKPQDNSASQT